MDEYWDEKVRGPKMSEDTGKIIFKYQPAMLSGMIRVPPNDPN